jgi:hypothetical protein
MIEQTPVETAETAERVTRCWKGLDLQFACRGHQYEVGKTYTMDGDIEVCERGFHGCTSSLDVLTYYPAGTSRFAEVHLIGETAAQNGGDSKLCARQIRIVREISYWELWQAHRAWLAEATKEAAATGNWGHAAATGNWGHAAATGDSGHAAATGNWGIAVALGRHGRAKSRTGIVLAHYDHDWNVIAIKTAMCGAGPGCIKPDTWYHLGDSGEFEECDE